MPIDRKSQRAFGQVSEKFMQKMDLDQKIQIKKLEFSDSNNLGK